MKSSFILSEMWSGLTDFGMTPEIKSCLLIHNLHYSGMLDSRTVNRDFTAIQNPAPFYTTHHAR
jgi:hypothetical protein